MYNIETKCNIRVRYRTAPVAGLPGRLLLPHGLPIEPERETLAFLPTGGLSFEAVVTRS